MKRLFTQIKNWWAPELPEEDLLRIREDANQNKMLIARLGLDKTRKYTIPEILNVICDKVNL